MIRFLRNNTKQRVNKKYVTWFALHKKRLGFHGHHILSSFMGGKKWNDLLLANTDNELHNKLHYHKELVTEEEEKELIVEALENLFDYVYHLQEQLKGK